MCIPPRFKSTDEAMQFLSDCLNEKTLEPGPAAAVRLVLAEVTHLRSVVKERG